MKYQNSIFIFRRDFRIFDNTGLIAACKNSEKVLPCFIFSPSILENQPHRNSKQRLAFVIDSISDLEEDFNKVKGKLHLHFDEPSKVISLLKNRFDIDAVFVNMDYTPASKNRDRKLMHICKENNIDFQSFHDSLLQNVDEIKTSDGKPYTVFTPFFRKAKDVPVRKPQRLSNPNFITKVVGNEITINDIRKKLLPDFKQNKILGGRKNAKKILGNLKKFKNYENERNLPYLDATTKLSAHNRFGTCSIREVYHEIVKQLGADHTLITEIYWRDFFTGVMHHFPYSYKNSFRKKYSKFPWSKNQKFFEKWCTGVTGFPIIDSGMRELNSTGYMHNRVRMIVASFLTKDLHIDWKMGERYFAQKLIDYDPSVNVGNWQWAASTGCDSQPWFRIFNPWLQQKKFDPECKYIKNWIPELSNLSPMQIHNWYKMEKSTVDYPLPIVDHGEESSHTKELFSRF